MNGKVETPAHMKAIAAKASVATVWWLDVGCAASDVCVVSTGACVSGSAGDGMRDLFGGRYPDAAAAVAKDAGCEPGDGPRRRPTRCRRCLQRGPSLRLDDGSCFRRLKT